MANTFISQGGLITPKNVQVDVDESSISVGFTTLKSAIADTQILVWAMYIAVNDTDSGIIDICSDESVIMGVQNTGRMFHHINPYPFYLLCATNEPLQLTCSANLGVCTITTYWQEIEPITRT